MGWGRVGWDGARWGKTESGGGGSRLSPKSITLLKYGHRATPHGLAFQYPKATDEWQITGRVKGTPHDKKTFCLSPLPKAAIYIYIFSPIVRISINRAIFQGFSRNVTEIMRNIFVLK